MKKVMKGIRYIVLVCVMLLWTSCTPLLKRTYKSVNDYPVPSGDLTEMTYSSAQTTFSFWSPAADEVRLMLFRYGNSGHAYRTVHMLPGMNGVWSATVEGDLIGQYYTFNVKIKDKWHGDTPGINAHAVNVNGKRAAIINIDATNPKGWENDARPSHLSNDVVIYNLHFRDFTNDTTSGIRNRGRYLALTERGTHTSQGLPTGIDHLKELGVTHVQLMPSYDYVDNNEGNIRHSHYTYGIQPLNFNVPEGNYSTRSDIPAVRIKEFKQMVLALHKAGIRVVMEMSFNHVPDAATSTFERAVPGYFFRMKGKNYADGSGLGSEIATERPMVRKFIVESIRYWINEYHIDGFYFDMMGLTDLVTMRAVRAAASEIDPSILIYGDGTSPAKAAIGIDSLAVTANAYRMPGVGAYSHELRNALLGPEKEAHKPGFLGGLPGDEETIRFAWTGAIPNAHVKFYRVHDAKRAWAAQPTQLMAYLSSHNDFCLVDRLRASLTNVTPLQQMRLSEVAMTAILTSQGTPIIFNGDEMMRDKRMVRNSMESSDSINDINWQLKSVNNELFEYVKGLIQLRHHHPAFRMGNADMVRSHLQYLTSDPCTVAFMLSNHAGGDEWGTIIVAFNTGLRYAKVNVPEGTYTVVCNNGKVVEDGLGRMNGPLVGVPGQTSVIMWKP
jgi:pullulanase